MKKLWNKYSLFFIFFLLAAVNYFLNKNLAFLLFNIFWQVLVGVSIISSAKTFFKTRKGPYVKGKLVSFNQVDHTSEADKEFEATVEFSWPTQTHRYQIIRTLRKVRMEQDYKIWVDEKDPAESVIVDRIDSHWYFSIVGLSLVQVALLYVDYVLILKMLS